MSAARLRVWQARENYPTEAFAVLSGRFAHAISERLDVPAMFCFARCGELGFAQGDATDGDQLCLRCQKRLASPEGER